MLSWLNLKLTKVLPSFKKTAKLFQFFQLIEKLTVHATVATGNIPVKPGWATTIHKCQGMTIGQSEPFNYIVINPGAMSFESRNPGALFVALSRAKSAIC